MSHFHATVFAVSLGATMFGETRPAAAAGPVDERTLTLVMMDEASGTHAADITAAQSIAGRVFTRIGVRVEWRTRKEFARAMPAAPALARAYCQSVIFVHLVAAAPPNPNMLGKALTDSNVVWAYLPRIEEAATRADTPVSAFLGYVIAHELGHVLLGAEAHGAFGLMAGSMNVDAIRRRSLGFLPDQAARIHRTLAAWASRDAAVR